MTTDDEPLYVSSEAVRLAKELHDYKWNNVQGGSLPDNLLVELTKQCVSDSRRWFPDVNPGPDASQREIIHHTVAMFGEMGEFANIVKKIERGSLNLENPNVQFNLRDELADVLIYLLNLAGILNVDLLYAYGDKRVRNEERFGHHD